jgi:DhnA family fructose-bisphosphate aldolase class Ia
MSVSGKSLRLHRILDVDTRKSVVVAFDHGLMLGPIPGISPPRERIAMFLEGGADAVLMSPGVLRANAEVFAGRKAGVIVRLDWTNMWRDPELLGFTEGRSCAIALVEDAVRWGADAVLTYLFVGLTDAAVEAEEVRRNAEVNRACERFGMVHMIEPMARGSRVKKANSKELVALHTRMAGELGADLIKTDFLDQESDTAEVVSTCLAPVLLAGGPKITESSAIGVIERSVRAGAAGIVFGRNVFQASDPVAFLRDARRAIHGAAGKHPVRSGAAEGVL